jgi:hypothetical protein
MNSVDSPLDSRVSVEPGFDEAPYRPMPVLAPITVGLGVLSVAGLIAPLALIYCVVATLLSLYCFLRIRRSRGELSGGFLSFLGLLLSAGFLVSGSALHAYTYVTELPEGYERLDFGWLAKQSPIIEDGVTKIAPAAKELDGKKVFIKGYMYPEKQTRGLTKFVLCKDTGECCFGGKPKITDLIAVEFKPGVTANHREKQLVGVAGVLRTKPRIQGGQVFAIYTLEGDVFR